MSIKGLNFQKHTYLFSLQESGCINLIDVNKGKFLQVLTANAGNYPLWSFDQEGTYCMTFDKKGIGRIWKINTAIAYRRSAKFAFPKSPDDDKII